jgi:hypothetical protein
MACCWVSCTGFEAFGSSFAFMALTMRRAWYFENFIFDVISGSFSFHIDSTSRNVAAARSVSVVCLSNQSASTVAPVESVCVPIDFVLRHLPLCLPKCL